MSGVPYWWAQSRLVGQLCLGRGMADHVPGAVRGRIVAEARCMALIYPDAAASLW